MDFGGHYLGAIVVVGVGVGVGLRAAPGALGSTWRRGARAGGVVSSILFTSISGLVGLLDGGSCGLRIAAV
jgi:hypothetical protein